MTDPVTPSDIPEMPLSKALRKMARDPHVCPFDVPTLESAADEIDALTAALTIVKEQLKQTVYRHPSVH